MGVFSVWSLVLYVIVPLGLTLLLLLSFPPIDYRSEIRDNPPKSLARRWGFVRRFTNKVVEKVLFTRLGFFASGFDQLPVGGSDHHVDCVGCQSL